MKDKVRDLVRNSESLPDTGMGRMVADCTSVPFDDQYPREVTKWERLCPQVQTLRDQLDGYRHAVGFRVAKRFFSLVVKILDAHHYGTSIVAEPATTCKLRESTDKPWN
jgi:hypothetical protein